MIIKNSRYLQRNVIEPTPREIQEIIKSSKNNNSGGENGIKAEILKEGGNTLQKRIEKLVIKVWREDKIPKDWKNSILLLQCVYVCSTVPVTVNQQVFKV